MNHLCQYKTYTIGPLLPSVGVSGDGEESPLDGETGLRSMSLSSAPILLGGIVGVCLSDFGNPHSLGQSVHLEKFLIYYNAAKTLTPGNALLQVDK